MPLNKEKLELIKKISDSCLTKAELTQLVDKAKEIINQRTPKKE